MRALLLVVLLAAAPAFGQGCSQCRETVGQTPARTQAAYRRGILVLMMAAGAVIGAGVVVARRFQR